MGMGPYRQHLQVLQVKSPCPERWDRMDGDERVRFCRTCDNHVYNLSVLTRDEIEKLVGVVEQRVCARFLMRADGTVVTAEQTTCDDARKRKGKRQRRRALMAAVGISAASVAAANVPLPVEEQNLGAAVVPSAFAEPVRTEIAGDIEVAGRAMGSYQPYSGTWVDPATIVPYVPSDESIYHATDDTAFFELAGGIGSTPLR